MQIILDFFQDDATGSYGLTHRNSIDEGFNAFWDGKMMFHDVFEHYFEGIHPMFKGEYGFNSAGEMAAAGHYGYYTTHFSAFRDHRNYQNKHTYTNTVEDIISFTKSLLQQGCYVGDIVDFGQVLTSKIRKQPDTKNYTFESALSEYECIVEALTVGKKGKYNSDEEVAQAKFFKQSINKAKINNLHRWGYYQAEKMFHWSEKVHNEKVIIEFISFWEQFCEDYDAQQFTSIFKSIVFDYKWPNQKMQWKATFLPKYVADFDPISYKKITEKLIDKLLSQ